MFFVYYKVIEFIVGSYVSGYFIRARRGEVYCSVFFVLEEIIKGIVCFIMKCIDWV